jgi:hypothetical protein
MPNIKFSYLYRDGANYKKFGNVVYLNTDHINLGQLELEVRKALIDGCFFNADEWGIPSLFFEHCDSNDPLWHEFIEMVYVDEPADKSFYIGSFEKRLKSS